MIIVNKQLEGLSEVDGNKTNFPHLFNEQGMRISNFYAEFDKYGNLQVETLVETTSELMDKINTFLIERRSIKNYE